MHKYKYLSEKDLEDGKKILEAYALADEDGKKALQIYAGCLKDMALFRGNKQSA